jgi:sugar phosphate isomerase/epimerase
MRLGGPVYDFETPAEWVAAVQAAGYRAAYCPVEAGAGAAAIAAYALAARQADIVIAEVGAWSNPLSPDAATCAAALEKCQRQLALAEAIGALCCVNISGSRGAQWDGPHPDNLTPASFDLIVETVRAIIDAVKPRRACYSLETMPWAYPDSIDSYLRLIEAIDRPAFGVHFDPVNMISSLDLYTHNGAFIRDAFSRLGPHLKSVHIKDVRLEPRLTLHLEEVRPGLGSLDYPALLTAAHRLDPDLPLMLEHLPREAYPPAAAFVRETASALGLPL